ncbi:MAG: Mut7-C RNAse domain-containing protein [Desulfobacterota bacterium]|nr:Mut7-C RNAse domain-containing protein [Thermodesulfobacteriota bacterium]
MADRTLGKLVKGLRMLGFDTLYYTGRDIHQLLHLSRDEGRVLLTRDRKLALRRPKDRILTITEDKPSRQVEEVIRKASLRLDEEVLFSRCLLCNELLEEIPKKEAEGRVPDFIFNQHGDFFRCPACRRIYWPGSHLTQMRRRVEELAKGVSVEKGPAGPVSLKD